MKRKRGLAVVMLLAIGAAAFVVNGPRAIAADELEVTYYFIPG